MAQRREQRENVEPCNSDKRTILRMKATKARETKMGWLASPLNRLKRSRNRKMKQGDDSSVQIESIRLEKPSEAKSRGNRRKNRTIGKMSGVMRLGNKNEMITVRIQPKSTPTRPSATSNLRSSDRSATIEEMHQAHRGKYYSTPTRAGRAHTLNSTVMPGPGQHQQPSTNNKAVTLALPQYPNSGSEGTPNTRSTMTPLERSDSLESADYTLNFNELQRNKGRVVEGIIPSTPTKKPGLIPASPQNDLQQSITSSCSSNDYHDHDDDEDEDESHSSSSSDEEEDDDDDQSGGSPVSSITIPRVLRDSVSVRELVKSFGMCVSDVAFALRHSACACNGSTSDDDDNRNRDKANTAEENEAMMDDLINRVRMIEVKRMTTGRTIYERYSMDTHDGASL